MLDDIERRWLRVAQFLRVGGTVSIQGAAQDYGNYQLSYRKRPAMLVASDYDGFLWHQDGSLQSLSDAMASLDGFLERWLEQERNRVRRQVSLRELFVSGQLGDLRVGMTMAELINTIGPPTGYYLNTSTSRRTHWRESSIWWYGDIELHFHTDDRVAFIFTHLLTWKGSTTVQRTRGMDVDLWLFSRDANPTLGWVKQQLASEGTEYTEFVDRWGHASLQGESGAWMAFPEGNEDEPLPPDQREFDALTADRPGRTAQIPAPSARRWRPGALTAWPASLAALREFVECHGEVSLSRKVIRPRDDGPDSFWFDTPRLYASNADAVLWEDDGHFASFTDALVALNEFLS